MNLFPNDKNFYEKYSKIENIKYYPYVGINYEKAKNKILVFAHNMYCDPKDYENHKKQKSSPTHFSDAMEEYTYERVKWTKAFRNFVRGSLGINEVYHKGSSIEVKTIVDDFVSRISFVNYVNDLVPSETAINVTINPILLSKSHIINKEIITLLKPTHIVSWGNHVFNYLRVQDYVEVIMGNDVVTKNIAQLSQKAGFGYMRIKVGETEINVLKVFHPSMPSFGQKKPVTQEILKYFYNLE